MTDDAVERARSLFADGDFDASRATALEGLAEHPDDVELLLLAGQSGVEVEADDAVTQLRRATELAPDDVRTWHALGEALATEGLTDEANQAFRRAVELDPSDQAALTHLGHTSVAVGRDAEGMGYLARAAGAAPGASSAAISLVEMYRSLGQNEEALVQALRLAEAVPDDVITRLDVAELSLALGQLDDAESAFLALREIDDVPGHEAYPLHGLMLVRIRRKDWDGALALTADASTIDPHGLVTDIAAFLRAQRGEDPGEATPPSREQIEAALTAQLAEYRRMHADDRRAGAGSLLG